MIQLVFALRGATCRANASCYRSGRPEIIYRRFSRISCIKINSSSFSFSKGLMASQTTGKVQTNGAHLAVVVLLKAISFQFTNSCNLVRSFIIHMFPLLCPQTFHRISNCCFNSLKAYSYNCNYNREQCRQDEYRWSYRNSIIIFLQPIL